MVKYISDDKTYFSLLLILLSLLPLIYALGEHGLYFPLFFRWVINTPSYYRTLVHFFRLGGHLCTPNSTPDTCPFLPLVSLFFFIEVLGTCPFLFPRVFLHNPCLFCIESFWRDGITTLGTVSDNIFSNFNEWWWMV